MRDNCNHFGRISRFDCVLYRFREKGKEEVRAKLYIVTAALMLCIFPAMESYAKETVEVPADVIEISEELGKQYNICPELIQAMCFKESSFRPDIESGGCFGIMQVNPKWHKERIDRLGVTDIFDMRGNMAVGVDYLLELIGQYEDVSVALMVYNGDSSVEDVICGKDDISAYVNEILSISAELERKNGK